MPLYQFRTRFTRTIEYEAVLVTDARSEMDARTKIETMMADEALPDPEEIFTPWSQTEPVDSKMEIVSIEPVDDAGFEQGIRKRRMEILMGGSDGTDGCAAEEAREIAWSESLEDIMGSDGDHIARTDPELSDWYAVYQARTIRQ